MSRGNKVFHLLIISLVIVISQGHAQNGDGVQSFCDGCPSVACRAGQVS